MKESNIIFCTGAPGSSWSFILKSLTLSSNVDRSDESESRVYRHHFGSYFGPSMEFGDKFYDIANEMDGKLAILEELLKPYRDSRDDKPRLFKSHHFAYNLGYLRSTFPEARFILIHRDDDASLRWWYQAGGFDIPYPRYDWYRDRETMARQIAVENDRIRQFAASQRVELAHRSTADIAALLGLSLNGTPPEAHPAAHADVTIGIL